MRLMPLLLESILYPVPNGCVVLRIQVITLRSYLHTATHIISQRSIVRLCRDWSGVRYCLHYHSFRHSIFQYQLLCFVALPVSIGIFHRWSCLRCPAYTHYKDSSASFICSTMSCFSRADSAFPWPCRFEWMRVFVFTIITSKLPVI